jgi:membrane-associated phospholipid phosphatase
MKMFRYAGALLREKWWLWLLLALLAAAGAVFLFPRDAEWERCLVTADNRLAGAISFWGDFPRGWLALIVVLAFRRRWRAIALAALLAGAFAGGEVQTVSSLTGRPRPSAGVADTFRGPTLDLTYKSFPSGHTACAFAVATALVLTLPALGVPCLLAAAVVGWSRMALNAHYPSDVWVGMCFGVLNGLLFGLAVRRQLEP